MIMKLFICILSFSTLSTTCWASNALRGKQFNRQFASQPREELKISEKVVVRSQPTITYDDVARIMPTDIDPNADSSHVTNRILQRSASALFNSSIVKNSFLMKTAKKVENTTKLDVAIQQENTTGIDAPIEHKFNFDFQAFKGEAKMTYTGLIDSKIEYQALNDTLSVSLEEQLSENSKIALSHLKDREQSRQLLQYQVTW